MPDPSNTPASARKRRRVGLSIGALTAIVAGLVVANSGGRAPRPPAYPDPNGYDDLVAAGSLVAGKWPGSGDLAKAEVPEIRAFVEANRAALDLARLGLARECAVPIRNQPEWMTKHIEDLSQIRAVGRLLQGEAMVAEADGRIGDATRSYRDQMAVGQAATQGGLAIDQLLGCAVQTSAILGLRKLHDRLPAEEIPALLRELEALDRRRDPLEAVDARWQAFYQAAHGPYMRLLFKVNGMDKTSRANEAKMVRAARDKIERDFRFLLVELAIRAYHRDKQSWPRSAADLVPAYLSAVPIDPGTGKPIDYPANASGELTDDLSAIARPDGELAPAPKP